MRQQRPSERNTKYFVWAVARLESSRITTGETSEQKHFQGSFAARGKSQPCYCGIASLTFQSVHQHVKHLTGIISHPGHYIMVNRCNRPILHPLHFRLLHVPTIYCHCPGCVSYRAAPEQRDLLHAAVTGFAPLRVAGCRAPVVRAIVQLRVDLRKALLHRDPRAITF